jgi:hypothetical protein
VVSSRSPIDARINDLISTIETLKCTGKRLNSAKAANQWYVLDGRLYRVAGDHEYETFGDYHEFCGRRRERGEKLPWER